MQTYNTPLSSTRAYVLYYSTQLAPPCFVTYYYCTFPHVLQYFPQNNLEDKAVQYQHYPILPTIPNITPPPPPSTPSLSLSLTRSLQSLLVSCLKEVAGYELLKLLTLLREVRVGEGMVEKLIINRQLHEQQYI